MAKSDGMKYVGDGVTFVPGVPMRDLTGEELATMPKDLKEAALKSGLYRDRAGYVETPATREGDV
jgi:hypothetical protein